MKKKLISLLFLCSVLVGVIPLALVAGASENTATYIEDSDVPLKLWYDEEALKENENSPAASTAGANEDIGWAHWSLPIGNGYFGANVFGRTETERIQITEKTLMNPTSVKDSDGTWYTIGGLNSFSETYIDFNHTNSDVTDYNRYLDLKTAISGVEYTYGGVKYTREYFTSYPDKALIIRLDADKDGKLSFTLRPTIPYEETHGAFVGDGVTKSGTVTASVENGVGQIELAGKMGYYDIDFLGLYRVYTNGGTVSASSVQNTYKDTDGATITDTDGTIVVNGATSAYIVVTLGTDYELSEEMFTSAETNKPTKNTTIDDTRAKVGGYMSAIDAKISGKSFENAYKALKDAHIADHSSLFGRVSLELEYNNSDLSITTDKLLDNYKGGTASTYLEALIFQYGRYLLIASSRDGALPSNLQGAWNTYNTPPWASAYTHNINVQMNYWPAFSTNLAETFEAYVDYNRAYMAQAEIYADQLVKANNPDVLGKDGGNGWVVGNHIYPYRYTSDESAGNLGFMTQVFWEYYAYTKDPAVLELVYDVLINAARYITKCVELDENGNYLVQNCDSPEMRVNGVWYYTVGTTYAQTFAYLNNYNALEAAKALGINLADSSVLSTEEYSILKTVMEQIDKYDPINVGLSGQIKEFREETYYSSVGDDPKHRHVSQLVGLYPGNIINSSTPAWLDAARVALENRGLGSMGWSRAHRMNLWARVKDGDEAYRLYASLIKDRTSYNLWNVGPPFQIDGSFGATAGVSEMLLQSHEGYIEPLAALPAAWANGSYTGLIARGNFEVSAAWENGTAKTFNITSKSGGTASVYYPSITSAYVIDGDGNTVSYQVTGTDLISFETEVGKTYTIYGFSAVNVPDAPANLVCTENTSGGLNFTWSAVSGVSSYNVYVAVENAATYTLIGTTSTNSFAYTPDASVEGLRTTYAVTAVGERESHRSLVYTVETVVTEYGEIPSSSVSGDATFAIFAKKKGATAYKFIETGSQFIDDGIDKARQYLKSGSGTYQGGTVVVYLLGDYTSKGTSKGAGWNAAFQINGTLIVDLGGHKLTSTAPRLVGLEAKDSGLGYDSVTGIEFKNGTLCTSKPIVELFGSSGQYTGNKICNVTFSGITFTPNGTPSEFTMFNVRGSFSSTQKATFNVTLDCCDLNYSSLSKITVVSDSCTSGAVTSAVSFKGGNILAKDFDSLVILGGASDEDSDVFMKSAAGARTEFTVKYTDAAPTLTFNTDDGIKHLASATINNATAEESRTTTYRLSSFSTPYGYVPENLKDKSFALFYNGLHIGSYGVFANALDKVKELTYPNAKGIFIGKDLALYALKDYEYTDTAFTNFAQITGTLTLDLGGKTLTMKNDHLFDLVGKAVNNTVLEDTCVYVKNGTILTNGKPIMLISSKGTSGNFGYTGTKKFEFTYENVTFNKAPSATVYAPIVDVGVFDETEAKNVFVSATFNECSFTGTGSTMFNLSVSNFIDAQILINGGTLTTDALTENSFIRSSDADDTLTFGKLDSGNYTELVLPKSEKLPSMEFNGNTLVFVKISESSESVTYRLADKSQQPVFIPKMNVTLDGRIVINVYIPTDMLVKFTLEGTAYENLEELESYKCTIDGKYYYLISTPLDAKSGAETITLDATISNGGSTSTFSFTFSTPKYASEIIESGSEPEKQLVKDMLSYIRAAYVYFDVTNTDAIAAIDAVIGEDYDESSPPLTDGAITVTSGFRSATFVLESTPIVRFYLNEGTDADGYSFKIGGITIPHTAGANSFGSYVQIEAYAYEICEKIDCYYNGASIGSYNVSSYLTWAGSQNDATLVSLVERFLKYTQSCRDYRNSLDF